MLYYLTVFVVPGKVLFKVLLQEIKNWYNKFKHHESYTMEGPFLKNRNVKYLYESTHISYKKQGV